MKQQANFFQKYLRHLRDQPREAQRVHAFSISGIITVIVAVLWLHLQYGFWSGGEYERKETTYETTNLTPYEGKSPGLVLEHFFREAKLEISKIWGGGFFGTSTFERVDE